MESIRSSELFGRASASQGPRPMHTAEGHEMCAYYMTFSHSESADFMKCPHGEYAQGAFYSEDYIYELRTLAHRLIGHLNGLDAHKVQHQVEGLPVTTAIALPDIAPGHWRNVMSDIARLRELTK